MFGCLWEAVALCQGAISVVSKRGVNSLPVASDSVPMGGDLPMPGSDLGGQQEGMQSFAVSL